MTVRPKSSLPSPRPEDLVQATSLATVGPGHWAYRQPSEALSWGRWRLNLGALTLEFNGGDYYVDLESCTTSAEVLDSLCQIAQKTWATAEDLGDLLRALDALLSPQARLCSMGVERGPVKITRNLIDAAARHTRAHRRWAGETAGRGFSGPAEWRRLAELEREEGLR